jgi:hypothetical protein
MPGKRSDIDAVRVRPNRCGNEHKVEGACPKYTQVKGVIARHTCEEGLAPAMKVPIVHNLHRDPAL